MQVKSYIQYRKERLNAQGIHSPFVFDFYNNVLKKAKFVDDRKIQKLRKNLLQDQSKIEVLDFGAGSKNVSKGPRTIARIAKVAGMERKFGKLIIQIIDYYGFSSAVELGTSLGIGTAYISNSKAMKTVVSLEGCPRLAEKAKSNLQELKISEAQIVEGEFAENLKMVSEQFQKIDLIYIDGNHKYEPTIKYFNDLIDKLDDNSFMIFDDIHWSEEMEKAWKEIADSEKVNVSIDLFRMGIVCKKTGQAKQHFILKY